MKIGDRIYYTGDQANRPAFGTITNVISGGKWNPEAVNIKYDTPRFDGDEFMVSLMIPVVCFKPSIGRRFMTLAEHEEMRQAEINASIAWIKRMQKSE